MPLAGGRANERVSASAQWELNLFADEDEWSVAIAQLTNRERTDIVVTAELVRVPPAVLPGNDGASSIGARGDLLIVDRMARRMGQMRWEKHALALAFRWREKAVRASRINRALSFARAWWGKRLAATAFHAWHLHACQVKSAKEEDSRRLAWTCAVECFRNWRADVRANRWKRRAVSFWKDSRDWAKVSGRLSSWLSLSRRLRSARRKREHLSHKASCTSSRRALRAFATAARTGAHWRRLCKGLRTHLLRRSLGAWRIVASSASAERHGLFTFVEHRNRAGWACRLVRQWRWMEQHRRRTVRLFGPVWRRDAKRRVRGVFSALKRATRSAQLARKARKFERDWIARRAFLCLLMATEPPAEDKATETSAGTAAEGSFRGDASSGMVQLTISCDPEVTAPASADTRKIGSSVFEAEKEEASQEMDDAAMNHEPVTEAFVQASSAFLTSEEQAMIKEKGSVCARTPGVDDHSEIPLGFSHRRRNRSESGDGSGGVAGQEDYCSGKMAFAMAFLLGVSAMSRNRFVHGGDASYQPQRVDEERRVSAFHLWRLWAKGKAIRHKGKRRGATRLFSSWHRAFKIRLAAKKQRALSPAPKGSLSGRACGDNPLRKFFARWKGWSLERRHFGVLPGRKTQQVLDEKASGGISRVVQWAGATKEEMDKGSAEQLAVVSSALQAWLRSSEDRIGRGGRLERVREIARHRARKMEATRLFSRWRRALACERAGQSIASGKKEGEGTDASAWVRGAEEATRRLISQARRRRMAARAFNGMRECRARWERARREGTARALQQWRDVVEWERERRERVSKNVAQKRVAVAFFCQWYWRAFSDEIDEAREIIAGSCEELLGQAVPALGQGLADTLPAAEVDPLLCWEHLVRRALRCLE